MCTLQLPLWKAVRQYLIKFNVGVFYDAWYIPNKNIINTHMQMIISALLVTPKIALSSSPDKLSYLYVPTNANKYAEKDKQKVCFFFNIIYS